MRAYSVLALKSVDDDERVIAGIASTPETDRQEDVVDPEGATFALPLPLLWQHNSRQPIGHVTHAKVTAKGIEIKAKIAKGLGIPWIDEAWSLIKAGLVRGLSIGMNPIETARIEGTFGLHFLKWEWLELSAVTIPANADASIVTIKSHDIGVPAAPGTGRRVSISPGASGPARTRASSAMKKTLSDSIKDFEATLAAKQARMDELVGKSTETGETFNEQEEQEYKDLQADVAKLTTHVGVLRESEERNKQAARPVVADPAARPHVVVVERKLEKGIGFARYVICKMAAVSAMRRGEPSSALEVAKMRYPDDSQLQAVLKTAVPAGSTLGSNWANDLVPYQVLASDFIDYLRPRTIIDRIQGFDRVPFNVRVGGFSAGTSGYWKGEGKPIPVSKATTTYKALTYATVGGLVVLTDELVRFSTPSAEQKVRNDIAAAVTARMDIDFVDPSNAGTANVKPASITNAIAAQAPSGTTAAKLRADLAVVLQAAAAANITGSAVIIMSKSMATQVSLMINTVGNADFPGMTPDGGTIVGIPVLTSEHLTAVGSPSTQSIIVTHPGEIMLADDGVVTVDASSEASIEMLDSSLVQDATTGTGTSLVNLWQNGLLGLRAERVVNWVPRRTGITGYISPAAYIVQ